MALIKCPECGKEFSNSIKRCPHCGYRNKKKLNRKTIFKIGICCLVALLLVSSSIAVFMALNLSDEEKTEVNAINNQITEILEIDINGQSQTNLLNEKEVCNTIVDDYTKLEWKQRRKIDEIDAVKKRIVDIDAIITKVKKEEVDKVIQSIDAIEEVTINSENDIENVKREYEKLDEEQKNQVTNFDKIAMFEKRHQEICVESICEQIRGLGTVSLENESREKIEQINDLYLKLSNESKTQVTNYSLFKKKCKQMDKLEDYKEKLLRVKSEIKEGNLNRANKILSKLPSQFKYKGDKVSSLKKRMNKKKAWLGICGEWKTTGGQMRVTQIWDYDGRSEWWYRDFDKGEEKITVKCKLQSNGKMKISLNGSIPIYTSYSSIQEGIETSYVSVSKTKAMSGFGTIRINKYTTVSISSDGIVVSYYKKNPNENQYFTYTYKTTMSFKKRTKKY